jgi:hypothetical protein
MKTSKYKNSRRRTRKIRGGSGIGVKVESGSESQYINPSRISLCPGCRSDNTTAQGAYSLNTPLPDWPPSWSKGLMVGGGGGRKKSRSKGKGRGKKGGSSSFTCGGCGQKCTEPPLKFLQTGGGISRGSKGRRGKKWSRKMGGGGFWDFAKPFWNPSNPGAVGYENGYKVLAPSCKGISPSGLGSPVSTSSYEPPTKPWSAEFRNDKHLYQKGGSGSNLPAMNVSRKMKGGSIVNDLVNFGRTAVYGIGTAFNNFRGVSNDIYAAPPTPLFGQFPKGYGTGNIIGGEKQFMDIKPHDIKNIYKHATSTAEKA